MKKYIVAFLIVLSILKTTEVSAKTNKEGIQKNYSSSIEEECSCEHEVKKLNHHQKEIRFEKDFYKNYMQKPFSYQVYDTIKTILLMILVIAIWEFFKKHKCLVCEIKNKQKK